MTSPYFQLSSSDEWLGSINIGLLWLRGNTIAHASSTCNALLDFPAYHSLVGQDFDQILQPCDTTGLYLWLNTIQKDPLLANTFTLMRGAKPIRLFASPPSHDHPQDLVLITITPISTTEMSHELHGSFKEFLDGAAVPAFVLSADHTILHWNHACEVTIGRLAIEMIGTRNQWCAFYPGAEPRPTLADLVLDHASMQTAKMWYGNSLNPSKIIPNALEASGFFPHIGTSGRWLLFTATPIKNREGMLIGAIETLVDITDLKNVENKLRHAQTTSEHASLEFTTLHTSTQETPKTENVYPKLNEQKSLTQNINPSTPKSFPTNSNEPAQTINHSLPQITNASSIHQIATELIHEINNPIGYIRSNLNNLNDCLHNLLTLTQAYVNSESSISNQHLRQQLENQRKAIDLDNLQKNALSLLHELHEGMESIHKAIQRLNDSSSSK